jgi:hypothetical protein
MPQPPHLVVENTLVNDHGSIPLELEAGAAVPASSAADDEWYLPSDIKAVFLGRLSPCYGEPLLSR